jgi:hypothetical protein
MLGLDETGGEEKTFFMARHRTTAKMHGVRDRPAAPGPDAADEGNGEVAPPAGQPADDAPAPDPRNWGALEERLAAEVAAREVSEQRTTDILARYFKVTLVMVGLNMLVAGASVATLIKFASRTQTVVVTQSAPPPAPLPPPVVEKAPAPPPVAPAAAALPADAPSPVPSRPPKLQLLGGPPRPVAKPAAPVASARVVRAPVMPAPKKTITFAARAAEDDAPEPPRLTERW